MEDRQEQTKADDQLEVSKCSQGELCADNAARTVEEPDSYEAARRKAFELLDTGFHLGYVGPIDRDKLHERERKS